MKLELEKISIRGIRFDDKACVKDGVLHVSEGEVEKLMLEDNELTGCYADITRLGESVRITPIKDVIEPRVRVSGEEIFPGVIGKVSPQMGIEETHALEGYCVMTIGRIVGFQEDVTDMNGPATGYCPFSQIYNLCAVAEPADNPEAHVYERAACMADLEVMTYVDKAVRELEPDETVTYETKPTFEQAAMYSDLPKVGYIHILQSQGLLHDTYCYGVDAKQLTPTFIYPTEIVDNTVASGSCVVPCDKVTTYHHFHNPVIENCYKHHGKDINFMSVIPTNEDVPLVDKERRSDMVAKSCNWMGLSGVLITEGGYGNPDTDLMINCRRVERVGTRVALITNEFSGKDGKSQSLAGVYGKADALASCGQGNITPQFPVMGKVIGTRDFIEVQIGGWDGCKNPGGDFKAELQIIIASTIASGFSKLATRGY